MCASKSCNTRFQIFYCWVKCFWFILSVKCDMRRMLWIIVGNHLVKVCSNDPLFVVKTRCSFSQEQHVFMNEQYFFTCSYARVLEDYHTKYIHFDVANKIHHILPNFSIFIIQNIWSFPFLHTADSLSFMKRGNQSCSCQCIQNTSPGKFCSKLFCCYSVWVVVNYCWVTNIRCSYRKHIYLSSQTKNY